MKLIQLPNGVWIDLKTVKAIRPLPTTEDGQIRARIVIDHGNNFNEIIYANDNEHAQELANTYAKLINELSF